MIIKSSFNIKVKRFEAVEMFWVRSKIILVYLIEVTSFNYLSFLNLLTKMLFLVISQVWKCVTFRFSIYFIGLFIQTCFGNTCMFSAKTFLCPPLNKRGHIVLQRVGLSVEHFHFHSITSVPSTHYLQTS